MKVLIDQVKKQLNIVTRQPKVRELSWPSTRKLSAKLSRTKVWGRHIGFDGFKTEPARVAVRLAELYLQSYEKFYV